MSKMKIIVTGSYFHTNLEYENNNNVPFDGNIYLTGGEMLSEVNRTFVNDSKNKGHNYLVVEDRSTVHCSFDKTGQELPSEYDNTSNSVDLYSSFNNYKENTKTDVRVGYSGNLSLENGNFDLNLNTVELDNDSKLTFKHNGKEYQISTRQNISEFKVKNMSLSINAAEYLYALCNTPENLNIFHMRAAVKFYEKDCRSTGVIDIIMKQNDMECKQALSNKIDTRFFYSALICDELKGSILDEALPQEIIGKICSYLRCNDIVLE